MAEEKKKGRKETRNKVFGRLNSRNHWSGEEGKEKRLSPKTEIFYFDRAKREEKREEERERGGKGGSVDSGSFLPEDFEGSNRQFCNWPNARISRDCKQRASREHHPMIRRMICRRGGRVPRKEYY